MIVFGLVGILNSFYMIANGRQNGWFVLPTFLLAAVIVAVGWVTTQALK